MTDITSSVSLNSSYTTDTKNTTTDKTSKTAETKKLSNTSVQRYVSSVSADNADAKAIFQKLSIDLKGDGKSINKSNLDDYISKAENDKISISDEEMDALKTIQDNWDKISNGSESITYADTSKAGYKDTLLSIVPSDDTNPTDFKSDAKNSTAEAYAYIMQSALEFSTDNKENSSSGLSSYLNNLLSGTTDENDDQNSELIAKLTNMLAESQKNSTLYFEA